MGQSSPRCKKDKRDVSGITFFILKREKLFKKYQKLLDRISINSSVMDGLPVIKGTRIPVYLILELIEGGYTPEKIINEYPSLTQEDIKSAIGFAALLSSLH